jgi:hypothetical protein
MSAATRHVVLRSLVLGLALVLTSTLMVRAEDRPGPAKGGPAAAKDAAAPAKEAALPAKDAAAPDAGTIEDRVAKLEGQIETVHRAGNPVVFLALLLSGAFCALWAQNTNRSCVLWFFLGVIPLFNAITILMLLWKNSKDRKRQAAPVPASAKPGVGEPVGV